MKQSVLDHCIKGKPKFKLKDCLAQYDNAGLVALADKQHLLINMGDPVNLETLNRKGLERSLFTQIYSHFSQDLFYLPPREIAFINKLMHVDFKACDQIDYEDCKFLHSLGYIYLYDYKGQVYPMVPKEIKEVYHMIPKKELDDEMNLNNEFYAYATALIQIHGIYTIDHFVEVWNTYNKKKIDFDDALTYLEMMYDRQDYFICDYKYVVTNYPSNDEAYKLLKGTWSDDESVYRVPAKPEIDRYSGGELGKESPYYEKLAKLI